MGEVLTQTRYGLPENIALIDCSPPMPTAGSCYGLPENIALIDYLARNLLRNRAFFCAGS